MSVGNRGRTGAAAAGVGGGESERAGGAVYVALVRRNASHTHARTGVRPSQTRQARACQSTGQRDGRLGELRECCFFLRSLALAPLSYPFFRLPPPGRKTQTQCRPSWRRRTWTAWPLSPARGRPRPPARGGELGGALDFARDAVCRRARADGRCWPCRRSPRLLPPPTAHTRLSLTRVGWQRAPGGRVRVVSRPHARKKNRRMRPHDARSPPPLPPSLPPHTARWATLATWWRPWPASTCPRRSGRLRCVRVKRG